LLDSQTLGIAYLHYVKSAWSDPEAEMVQCYGTDTTEYALQHKVRHLKAQALIITTGLEAGCDPATMPTDGDFPKEQNKVDKKSMLWHPDFFGFCSLLGSVEQGVRAALTRTLPDIHQYFGLSTSEGVNWHFREVKRDAKAIKQEVDNGGNALNVDIPTTVKSTPSKGRGKGSASTKSTPAGGKTASAARKRKAVGPTDKDEGDGDSVNYSELDRSPSPTRRTKKAKVKTEQAADLIALDGTVDSPLQNASRSFADVTSEDDFEKKQVGPSVSTEYGGISTTVDPTHLHMTSLFGGLFDDHDGVI
jgi:hypothetical protein